MSEDNHPAVQTSTFIQQKIIKGNKNKNKKKIIIIRGKFFRSTK
jgi:hypothetical protein